jgi:hypothetical protein
MTFKQHYEYLEEQYVLEKLIKIVGPALLYKPENVMVSGPIGTHHFMLYAKLTKALAKKMNVSESKAEQIIDLARDNELITGFKTTEGKFVDRIEAWNIAKKYKKDLQQKDAWRQGTKGYDTPKLASEYL